MRAGGDIVVVGSINMDLVVNVDHLPAPGETILGSDYRTHHGGKGANQAVAAARAGANVQMLGAVGSDAFGGQLREGLEAEGIDVEHVQRHDGKSGVAFINVDKEGQNNIIVSPGANSRVTRERVVGKAFSRAAVVLLQLEIPLESVREAARLGKEAGATVVLNAAPAQELTKEDLRYVDVLVVNEVEAAALLRAGAPEDPQQALTSVVRLLELAPRAVITLGGQGAVWAQAAGVTGERWVGKTSTPGPSRDVEASGHEPAHAVSVVDATAAGDAFVGMMAARLAAQDTLANAVRWGNAAGALAATRAGAQPSLPALAEVEVFMETGRKGAGA